MCACVFWCRCRCCCCCCCCKLLKPKALHHLELPTWQTRTLFLSLLPPSLLPCPSSQIFSFPLLFPHSLLFSLPQVSLHSLSRTDRLVFHPSSLSFFFSSFSHYSRHQLLAGAIFAVNLLLLFLKFFVFVFSISSFSGFFSFFLLFPLLFIYQTFPFFFFFFN